MNAQTKLLEIWKASNLENYPTKLTKMVVSENMSTTRAINSGKLMDLGVSNLSKCTFHNDAIKAWNVAPISIKSCKTIFAAKREIRIFVKTLPV